MGTFNFEEVVHMLHSLKLIKVIFLFYFVSSDLSEMVDWLKSKTQRDIMYVLCWKQWLKPCQKKSNK